MCTVTYQAWPRLSLASLVMMSDVTVLLMLLFACMQNAASKLWQLELLIRKCWYIQHSKHNVHGFIHDWQGMVWNGMEDDFSIFHTGNFLPFHFHLILKIFHSIFHSILKFSSIFHFVLKFSSIFHSILPYQRNFWTGSNAMDILLLCNVVSNRSWMCANNTKMQRLVSGMHIAHGLMHRRSLDFELEGG